ncbi:hypothetical protein BGZ83_006631 [Gryganskiella cystojenkinii]|nr:hypothetical protein BGZ83_006631 [Gryganskiella cystojenkinii]
MCGSRLAGSDSADSAVYATVMLVQNTLPDISNQPQNPDQTKRDNSNVDLPIAKITATTEEHVEPHAKGQKKQSGSEEADDNGKDDGEDDGEDDSTDNDDEDNEDDEDDLADHRSGKALAAHPAEGSSENMSISSIPVASTAVAVACLLGVGAFLVYLGRKRKRERVRAAWVESVFGPGTQGGGADQGVDPFGRHQSQGPQRYSSRGYGRTPSPDDLESVSDLHSEMMMMDRRGSSQYNSNNSRQSSVVQNNFSPSVVVPAPVRDTRGASSAARRGYSYHHPRELESPPDFMRRQAGFAQTPKSQQQSQKHYMEFFGQNDGEEDAELTQLDEDELVPITPEASLGHPAVSVPRRPVSALVHKAPSPVHPLAFADQARSYRAIPQCSPFDQVENSDPFHDATTPESKSRSRHRPIPFEYRRTQAFANDESLPRFPTHVLEDSDTASIDTEVPASLPRHGSASHSNGGGIGVIKEQLRRLSTPYVKAIRQEQVGDASVKSTGEYDIEAITEEQGHGVMNPMPGPSPASERRSKAKHRQVHSGSLASFRGLDDQPQLRVMNPDH